MFEGIDLDWFTIGAPNIIMHFASGGGVVPDSIDSAAADEMTKAVLLLPEISPDIIINESLNSFVLLADTAQYSAYIKSFSDYARRGFFSYDKTVLNDYSSPFYHLVASPTRTLTVEQLPDSLLNLMPRTKDNLHLPIPDKISIINIF